MQESTTPRIVVPGRRARIQRIVEKPVWRGRHTDVTFDHSGETVRTRPLTISWPGGAIDGRPDDLPLADASLDDLEIEDALELVRNDRALYLELARVIAPGGILHGRVATTGPLAGLDSLNLYKYLSDITHSGLRIPETEELSFRRHLSVAELRSALGPSFELLDARRSGTALSEVVNMTALTALTWRTERVQAYLKLKPWMRRFSAFDAHIPAPGVGFWLRFRARRTAE